MWLYYHRTGKRLTLGRAKHSRRPTRAQLKKALSTSGKAVEAYLQECLEGVLRPRLFGRKIIRWMAYLISHESHHRDQIVLALKQAGLPLPERVAMQGLWGTWMFGK